MTPTHTEAAERAVTFLRDYAEDQGDEHGYTGPNEAGRCLRDLRDARNDDELRVAAHDAAEHIERYPSGRTIAAELREAFE